MNKSYDFFTLLIAVQTINMKITILYTESALNAHWDFYFFFNFFISIQIYLQPQKIVPTYFSVSPVSPERFWRDLKTFKLSCYYILLLYLIVHHTTDSANIMIKHLKAFYHQTPRTRLNVITMHAHKRVKENTWKGSTVQSSAGSRS